MQFHDTFVDLKHKSYEREQMSCTHKCPYAQMSNCAQMSLGVTIELYVNCCQTPSNQNQKHNKKKSMSKVALSLLLSRTSRAQVAISSAKKTPMAIPAAISGFCCCCCSTEQGLGHFRGHEFLGFNGNPHIVKNFDPISAKPRNAVTAHSITLQRKQIVQLLILLLRATLSDETSTVFISALRTPIRKPTDDISGNCCYGCDYVDLLWHRCGASRMHQHTTEHFARHRRRDVV